MVFQEKRTFISLLSQCLWPTNLAGLWLTISGSRSKSLLFFWSRGLTRSREKLKQYLTFTTVSIAAEIEGVVTCYLYGQLYFNHVVIIDTIKNWKHISTTTIPMATKLDRAVLYHKELLIIKLHDPSITWCCKVWGKSNFYVSTCYRSMVPNHGKVVTYCEGLPPTNSHKLLNMWSRNITGQIKKIISPLSQCLWSQSVDQSIDLKVCLSCDVSWRHVYLGSHETGGIVRSSDKLSTFLLLQDTHGRQSRQGDDLPWENPTIIATWPYLTREQ